MKATVETAAAPLRPIGRLGCGRHSGGVGGGYRPHPGGHSRAFRGEISQRNQGAGSAGRIRTYDQPVNSRLLYH